MFVQLLLYILCTFSLNAVAEVFHEKIIYGYSAQNRNLVANIYYNKSVSQKKLILISEGVHGHEHMNLLGQISNVLLLQQSNSKFTEFLNQGGVLLTIPKLNPDAVANNTRYSASGHDLNRHFFESKSSNSNEVNAFKDFLNKYIKYHKLQFVFAMDYHCCARAILTPGTRNKSHKSFYKYLKFNAKKFLGQDYIVAQTFRVFKSNFKGTLKDYLSSTFKAPSVTFESPDLNEKKNLTSHLNLWSSLFTFFSNKKLQTEAFPIFRSAFAKKYNYTSQSITAGFSE